MRTGWRRASLGAAVVGVAALALMGCITGSASEPGTASDPSDPPVESSDGATAAPPVTDAPVASSAPAGSAGGGAEPGTRESCEPALLDRFADQQPERGRIDDQVQVHGALDEMLFPTAPTCTISYVQGDRRWVALTWLDEPETAGAVIEELGAKGWEATETPTAGYVVTELGDGSATVEVHPIGPEHRDSGFGQIPQGIDVTMVRVLLP